MLRLRHTAYTSASRLCTAAVLTGIIGSSFLHCHDESFNCNSIASCQACPKTSSATLPSDNSAIINKINIARVTYTPEEVRQMDGCNGKPFWVSYRGEVFDLTRFKAEHPGGHLIEQTAGSDVEPFWNKWAAHFDSRKVKAVLNECKIGELSVCHYYEPNTEYASDPPREPQRQFHEFCCVTPASTQTHAHILNQTFLTPNDALYIRSHAPVPNHLTAESHDITFSTSNDTASFGRTLKTNMSLNDIRERFATTDVMSIMQCAGNRQIDDYKKLGINGFTGTPFQTIKSGMVGNTVWTGVRLDAVLPELFPSECAEEVDTPGSWHVIFNGADEYESSTPLNLVLQAATDGLIAYAMNGEALLPDHGYPVRVVLPGLAGARSVKWLEGITLSRQPSTAPWNSHYYRSVTGGHIQKLPLNSIILSPESSTVVQLREDGTGSVSVQGVAFSGGENTSIREVEVSADGGKSWTRARLLTEERARHEPTPSASVGDHSWIRFVAEVPVAVDMRSTKIGGCEHRLTLYSRAIDSLGKVQPEASPGGQRTYLYGGWGAVSLTGITPSEQ
mmetsp:Transcript_20304/g.37691  ORF Transcript_20304/g.37691 Transcript_20304/m.37691 type:complete len:562 (+) Transcript_20304:44-1729(+)